MVKQDNDKQLDRQECIMHCIVTRLSESESLAYLKSKGHDIKKTVYYDEKKKLKDNRIDSAHKIATGGFLNQHVQRIENFEVIENEYWSNYHAEDDPSKKSTILLKIQNLQPFITSAYDYTKEIIFEQKKLENIIKNSDGNAWKKTI